MTNFFFFTTARCSVIQAWMPVTTLGEWLSNSTARSEESNNTNTNPSSNQSID
jgi:hypothetical protein